MKNLLLLIFCLISIKSFAQIDPWKGISPGDSCKLDTVCPLVSFNTNQQGLWEIAKPEKIFLDAAFSPEKCLITDSINPYPINNTSSFIFKLPNDGLTSGLRFKHKYQTDSLKDGGYIEISKDDGQNWFDLRDPDFLVEVAMFNEENLYDQTDTLFNGHPGFSGSKDWEEVALQFIWAFPVKVFGDTALLRFTFISDSLDNPKDGWMIDDLKLFYTSLPGSVSPGIDKINIEIGPHPIQTESQISFDNYTRKALRLELLDLQGKIVFVEEGIRESRYQFHRRNLPAGIYLLRLSDESEILATQKLLLIDP